MFKKCTLLFLVINISSLYAILGGAGINIIQDQFKIPAEAFNFSPINDTPALVTTSAIESPIGIGGFAYLTLIPSIDFEAGYSLTFGSYKFQYFGVDEIKIPIAKGTWHVSAQYPFFNPPTMRFYFGVGINGTTWTAPVNSKVLEELNESDIDFDNEAELLKVLLEESSGYHLEFGTRFKPPLMPVSFNANARYNFVKDFYTDIDGYLTVSLGLAFAI